MTFVERLLPVRSFRTDVEVHNRAMLQCERWLNLQQRPRHERYPEDNYALQQYGDLRVWSPTLWKWVNVEVKGHRFSVSEPWFETVSNANTGREGWGWSNRADVLVVCLPRLNLLVACDLPALQRYMRLWAGTPQYPQILMRGYAGQHNPSYGCRLPLEDPVWRAPGVLYHQDPLPAV